MTSFMEVRGRYILRITSLFGRTMYSTNPQDRSILLAAKQNQRLFVKFNFLT